MDRERREALRGHAAMLVVAAAISGSFTLGRRAALHLDPAVLNAIRFALAALVLAPLALPRLRRAHLAQPWRYLVLGGTFAVYFHLMFVALRLADAVSLAAVFTLTPLMSVLTGRVILGQRATPRLLVALGLAAAGALWVIFRGDAARLLGLDLGAGELIFLVGCLAHAIYTPLVRRLNRGEPVSVFTFGTILGGTLVLAALGAPNLARTDWAAVPAIVWMTIAYLVVFATAGSFFLVQYATLRLPASKVMAYGYLVPSFVIVWEGLSGQGWTPPRVLVGAAVTALAMLLLLARDGAAGAPTRATLSGSREDGRG